MVLEDCPSNGRGIRAGPEAIVRTLQAMSISPPKPARPQKIVVRDRRFSFPTWGSQDLEIAIDYEPWLIDELYRGFQEILILLPKLTPPVQNH